MKIPRDVSGVQLAIALRVYGYRVTRQTGSHIRLTTTERGEHHVTVPAHAVLRVGTRALQPTDATTLRSGDMQPTDAAMQGSGGAAPDATSADLAV